MGELSKIAWTTSTFNPWIGCTKVSAGCTNCYAEVNTFVRARRARGLELWGPKAERHIISEAKWSEVPRWNEQAAASGEPWRVFCASMADVFEDREDLVAPRARLLQLIEQTPALTWMLLTKRPENMVRLAARWPGAWPRNVWALTTVEDQAAAEKRLPELLRVPAAVRGVSAEPLLGPLDLRQWLSRPPDAGHVWRECDCGEIDPSDRPCMTCEARGGIDWVIIGGESGHHARPFDLHWARDLIAQCRAAGEAAPFFKQAGARPVIGARAFEQSFQTKIGEASVKMRFGSFEGRMELKLNDRMGGDLDELPEDLRVREWPQERP